MQLLYTITVLLLTLTLCYSQLSTDDTSEIMFTVTASGVITSAIDDISTVVTSITTETGTTTSTTTETTTSTASTTTETASTTSETASTASITTETASTTSETASTTSETASTASITTETASTASTTTQTETTASPTLETGTTASTTTQTGTTTSTITQAATTVSPTVETGTTASPSIETGTTASTTTQTVTTVSTTVETGTTASITTQTVTTASTTTQTVTTTSITTSAPSTMSTTTQINTTTSTTISTGTTTMTSTITTTSMETTMTSATNPTTTTSTTTTAAPPTLILLAQCNFNSTTDTSCFSDPQSYVTITNGTQFEQGIRGNSSVQPIAPVSGAPSFIKSNSYSERCQFPYNLTTFANINATWEMWFCFNDQCPASPGGNPVSCSADNYGLIPFMLGEINTNKSISLQNRLTSRIDGESNQQCLLYFYYITPGTGAPNENATIVTYATDSSTGNRTQIDSVSWSDMQRNSWQNRSRNFNFSSNTYTVTFVFTTNLITDRPIYFAVDNIELYNNNCTYVDQINNAEVPTPAPPIDPTSNKNLGLILGLSLGLGVPALLGIVAGSAYVYKQKRRKDTYLTEGYALDDRLTYPSYRSVDNENDNDISTTVF